MTFKELFRFKPFGRKEFLKLFSFVSLLFLLVTLLTLAISVGVDPSFHSLLSGKKVFSDYVETLSYCICKNCYSGEYGVISIYPPFAFLPFYPFALICKGPLEQFIAGNISLEYAYREPLIVVSFILYFLINMVLINIVIIKMAKFDKEGSIYLSIILWSFGPILYCFGRANVLLSAFLCGLIFFWLYRSEKRWQRELANLALAAAIGIKIYPALLLFIFIKDHRFLDLLKTLVYALILLFIPFLFIEQGFKNISYLWHNFQTFSNEGRGIDWSNISSDGLAMKFRALLENLSGKEGAFDTLCLWISRFLRYGLLLIALVLPFFLKKSKKYMHISLLVIANYELYQGVSYAYTMLFLLIPIIYFFQEYEELSVFNRYYYGIGFLLLAISFPYLYKFGFAASLILMALVVKCVIDLIKEAVILHSKKEKEE